jgi:hypothetical protein
MVFQGFKLFIKFYYIQMGWKIDLKTKKTHLYDGDSQILERQVTSDLSSDKMCYFSEIP